jgi:hypothetical protein
VKKKESHLHKYERGQLGPRHEIYKCMLPNCTHYLPNVFLAVGRLSLCWGNCGNAVLMTKDMVNHEKIKHPMCDSCREERKERRAALSQIVEVEE